jgi:NADH-quinone oxidoreductase subunit J
MVQITVYAGAIMVLFLFVIMLLGAELLRSGGSVLRWQPLLAFGLGALFVGVLGYVAVTLGGQAAALPGVDEGFGGPQSIGLELFQTYLLPFELTSFLLLVAMIGAVVLTRDPRGRLVGRSPSKTAGPDPRR